MANNQKCVAFVLVLFTSLSLAGLIYTLANMRNVRDSTADFDTLGSPCPITGVYQREYTKTDATSKADSCMDAFVYEFAVCDGPSCTPSSAPAALGDTTPRTGEKRVGGSLQYSFTEIALFRKWWTAIDEPASFAYAGWQSTLLISAEDVVRRGPGKCSAEQKPVPAGGRLKVGDWATCFKPVAGLNIEDLVFAGVYECGHGNAACIKVLSPAIEAATYTYLNMEGVYFCAAAVAFFLLFWACGCWNAGCSPMKFLGFDTDDDSSA